MSTKAPQLPEIDPSIPSPSWTMKPMLTQKNLDRYRLKSALTDGMERKLKLDASNFPSLCLQMLEQACDEDWLTKEDLSKRLSSWIYDDVTAAIDKSKFPHYDEEEDDPEFRRDVAKNSMVSVLAGALCVEKNALPEALALVAVVVQENFGLAMDVQSRMSRLQDLGHSTPSLADLPASPELYQLYHSIMSIKEDDFKALVLSDNAPSFEMAVEIAHRQGWGADTFKLWNLVTLEKSQAIRTFIYEKGVSSLDEDVYERFVNVFSKLDDDARFLLDETDIPDGFFQRHGDHLWYEVLDHLKRTGISGNRLNKASLWDAFDGAQKALSIMLKHHDFYPALMARTRGSNLAALQRYKNDAPATRVDALKALATFIGQHSYSFHEDGTPFKHGEVGGRSLPYILAKALIKAYPARELEPALSTDQLRAMFYQISVNMVFLRRLENKKFADHLISEDLGL